MKLMHYGDKTGGGVLATHPSKKEWQAFRTFVKEEIKTKISLPKEIDRNYNFVFIGKRQKWILPRARASTFPVIQERNQFPCSFCSMAEYNKKCPAEDKCLSFLFWVSGLVNKMSEVNPKEQKG